MEAHDKHVPDSKWVTKFSVAVCIIISRCCVSNIKWLCYSCHPLQKPVTSRECWQVCPVDCQVSPWSEWSSCPQQCVPGECKGSALQSSVNGRASKDFRTGCKNTVHLLVKINTLQFDDCVYRFIPTARGLNVVHSAYNVFVLSFSRYSMFLSLMIQCNQFQVTFLWVSYVPNK